LDSNHAVWTIAEQAEPVRFLIRDHDRKFTVGFDAVFRAESIRTVRTPSQAPACTDGKERAQQRQATAKWRQRRPVRRLGGTHQGS
jgi:hypothetical protein